MGLDLELRPLSARCGIDITAAGIGLWAQGGHWGPIDDEHSLAAVETALELGVTFYDTADVYGAGHSEELLGRAMKGRRERFIVGSKIGWQQYDGERNRSQYDSIEKLIAGVDTNLKRLGTDHLDLIQCHIGYEEANTQVFIDGFRRLKEKGKVRAWGVSTGDIAHVRRFNEGGDCDTLQIDYSILNRDPESEILPYCKEHGIGVIVRGPIAMGILADKFTGNETFKGDDFRKAWIDDPEQHAQFKRDLDTVKSLRPIAGESGVAELALRFALTHEAIATVIPGARNPLQADRNTRSMAKGRLSADVMAQVDKVVPQGGGRKIWPA